MIFKVQDSKIFINSFLDFIDLEKSTQNIYSETEQLKELKEKINNSKKGFNNSSFPLIFSYKSYITSHTQYFKTLKALSNSYIIENIQIFNGKITFTLKENKAQKISVEFKDNNLYINDIPVYFKTKNTIIFELIKLIFSYFQEHKTNIVDIHILEVYYKNNISSYKNLKHKKFIYEYLRRDIEMKSKEIEEKHNIKKPFLGINTSSIYCQGLQ